MIFFLLMLVLMFVALVGQFFVGVFPGMGGEILLLPVVFFYAAAALPLPGMLACAFCAGLMWECLTNVPLGDLPVEHADGVIFGWSIIIYAALGAVMNGLHPLFLRGRWQIHCLLVGVLTSLLVLLEYVVITFRRVPFALIWPSQVWQQILSSGLAAVLIAPGMFIGLNWIGRRLGHFEKPYRAE
jgi:hypothetical protein